MSFNPNMLLDTTPNSSKLAEMLLRLREEAPAITSLSYLDQSQIIPSLNQLSPPATELEVDSFEAGHTLPPAEACNCRKSKCLKLYCQCFAGKAICGTHCRCVECENKSVKSVSRVNAIKNVLDRNPNAFESKYRSAMETEKTSAAAVAHKNGCRCRKSMCLKKYCECFQGGVHCSGICTCLVCYNREGPPMISARANTVPAGTAHQGAMLEKYQTYSPLAASYNADVQSSSAAAAAHQSLKRSLSENSAAFRTIEEAQQLAFALQAINQHIPQLFEANNNMNNCANNNAMFQALNSSNTLGNNLNSVEVTSKPPAVPLIKRRKLEANTGICEAPASLQGLNSVLVPGTPSHDQNMSSSANANSVSVAAAAASMEALAKAFYAVSPSMNHMNMGNATPNSLSMAKALALLSNNLLSPAFTLANISNVFAQNASTPTAMPSVSTQSSTVTTSDSTNSAHSQQFVQINTPKPESKHALPIVASGMNNEGGMNTTLYENSPTNTSTETIDVEFSSDEGGQDKTQEMHSSQETLLDADKHHEEDDEDEYEEDDDLFLSKNTHVTKSFLPSSNSTTNVASIMGMTVISQHS